MKLKYLILCVLFTHINASILITKKASENNSVILANVDENRCNDRRIIFVEAKDHKENSKRAVYPNLLSFPRYVGEDKGSNYNIKGYKKSKPIAYIKQIPHTYSFIDANHGILNEHQLSISKKKCFSKFYQPQSKERTLQINELTRIAMERCKTAKDAIKTMGELSEKHGFFGYGETLIVADKNEGWVFEISPPPNGKGAIWVSKRVLDGEVFIASNEFRIEKIDQNDPNILHSKNLFEIAKKHKWLDENNKINWAQSLSKENTYSLNFLELQKKINPNLKFKKYSFSIKPNKKFSLYDIINILRDSNSTHKCGFICVTELRSYLPDFIGGVTWIGLDKPKTTCFVPFYAGVKTLPISYQTGDPKIFTHDSAWWVFNFVSNWALIKYSDMRKDIQKVQFKLENAMFEKQKEIEKKALKLYKKNKIFAREFLTFYCIKNANSVINQWWRLSYFLIEKYSN
jgi:dipeptidase